MCAHYRKKTPDELNAVHAVQLSSIYKTIFRNMALNKQKPVI